MIKELFNKQKTYLNYFFDHVSEEKTEQLLQLMVATQGMIIFTGVGKSGTIAKKLADTFVSTGTKALFLNPTDALHGDVGILEDKDLVVYLSKSGETDELIRLSSILSKRNMAQVALVCKERSTLCSYCTFSLYLPLERELCPFGLAPTTSTVIQLAFGDILSVALMELKAFTLDAYSLNHPAGNIGKQTRKVKEVMLKEDLLPISHQDEPLSEALIELASKRCGALLIVDDHFQMVGIFTTGDLNRIILKERDLAFSLPMSELMTRDFVSITQDELLTKALDMMQHSTHKRVAMLPVLEEKKILGLLLLHDIIEVQLDGKQTTYPVESSTIF